VATQNPELRAKFVGTPEQVMAYMHYVAEEIREILAQLGFRSLTEIIGRTELLQQISTGQPAIDTLNLTPLLAKLGAGPGQYTCRPVEANARVEVNELNKLLLAQAQPAIQRGERVELNLPINTTDRTVGATMSGAIARACGDRGLPDEMIKITFQGAAGQSFGAFNVPGVHLTLIGEANDYVAKGMRGGQIVIYPPAGSRRVASDHVIIGNTVLYGATGGSLFAAGQAGERFAVRNSGASAVVEAVGDHGCEYMTGGVVVVLGRTGYNFGAGMSGGLAFVYDEAGYFTQRINPDMVQIARVTSRADVELLRLLIMRHIRLTNSQHAQAILENWSTRLGWFWKVAPKGTIGATGVRSETQVALLTYELSQHVAA
jgi:glutamate synthase (ferredoxin)